MTATTNVDQRQATTTARGRLYEWKGEQFFSVTTLIKGLPRPGLERWKVRKVAEAAVSQRGQVAAILDGSRIEKITKRLDETTAASIRSVFGLRDAVIGPRGGIREPGADIWVVRRDPDAIERAVQFLVNAPYAETTRKAGIGTLIHSTVESYVLTGVTPPMPDRPLVMPPEEWTLNQLLMRQFLDFIDVVKPRIVAAEANVYNRREAYAGRLDLLAHVGNLDLDPETWPLGVIDVKSGKDVWPEAAYQQAAYSRAEFIGMPDGTEIKMPPVDFGAALHLTEDSWELVPLVIDDDVFRDFLYIRETFDILERRSKKIVGKPVRNGAAIQMLAVGNAPTLSLLPGGAVPGVVVELHPEPPEKD